MCPTPRRKRSKRSSSRRNNKWPNRMSHTLLLQCPHTYHHMPSSIIPRAQQRPTQLANHQQIKQHHNHQSTSHLPHHHRHHPSSSVINHQQQPPFSPGQQQQQPPPPPPAGEKHRARVRDSVKDHLIHQRNHHQWQTNLPLFRCGSVRSMHRVPLAAGQRNIHTKSQPAT